MASLHSGVALPDEATHADPTAPKAPCKTAIVNPVSGYAECVDPLGAPVDPPPRRPAVVKLAIFDFELDDSSPAAVMLGTYFTVQITDARTGKVLDQQAANFAGGPDGWASGLQMLLKHQVLNVAGQT